MTTPGNPEDDRKRTYLWAALNNLPDFEAELLFDVDAELHQPQPDLAKIYTWAPRFAAVTGAVWSQIRIKLTAKFPPRELRLMELEKRIKEARHTPRSERGADRAAKRDMPDIQTNGMPLRETVASSLSALRAANDPPVLFIRSGQMVSMSLDERERPSITAVSQDALRGRMDRCANYIRCTENSVSSIAPPIDAVKDILALSPSSWGLPPLEVLVEVPTLRADGTVLDRPGYDESSRMLYAPAPGLEILPVPDDPCTDEVMEAVELIESAIGEFPYADAASRANLYGLLLTPIIRPAITSCTPLALIDAPQAGTGKSLLVNVFSTITTGRPASMMPFPRIEEEMQKSIGATLLKGGSLICFDNVEGILQSPTLALALTAKEYEARILGVSQNMIAPNRSTWVANGNNIRPSGDMPRRCYHIRMDAKMSRPYQGRVFRHGNLLEWVGENRGALLRALLVIARAWYAHGKPAAVTDPLGSFEDWHTTVGGILAAAGVEGFLGNLSPFLTEADEAALQWEQFLSKLRDEFSIKPENGTAKGGFRVGDICSKVRGGSALYPCTLTLPDSLSGIDLRKSGSLESAIGKSFTKRLGARFGERELRLFRRQDPHSKNWEWVVLEGKEQDPK